MENTFLLKVKSPIIDQLNDRHSQNLISWTTHIPKALNFYGGLLGFSNQQETCLCLLSSLTSSMNCLTWQTVLLSTEDREGVNQPLSPP